jgi:hypothetical protein
VTSASHLTLTSSQLLGLLSLDNVLRGTNSRQDGESVGSLGSSTVLENSRVDD